MPLVDRAESVLVVVDTQPGFLAQAEPEHTIALNAVEKAVWLAAVARELGIPAVVTEEAPDEEGSTEPRLLDVLDAPVFTKPAFGLASCPDIVHAILETKRSTAVLMGFETDVCVLQSAIGLLDDGLRVIAVEDATFSPGEMHERGLARLRDAGVALTHCKALAYEWVRSVEGTALLPRPAPFRL